MDLNRDLVGTQSQYPSTITSPMKASTQSRSIIKKKVSNIRPMLFHIWEFLIFTYKYSRLLGFLVRTIPFVLTHPAVPPPESGHTSSSSPHTDAAAAPAPPQTTFTRHIRPYRMPDRIPTHLPILRPNPRNLTQTHQEPLQRMTLIRVALPRQPQRPCAIILLVHLAFFQPSPQKLGRSVPKTHHPIILILATLLPRNPQNVILRINPRYHCPFHLNRTQPASIEVQTSDANFHPFARSQSSGLTSSIGFPNRCAQYRFHSLRSSGLRDL